MKKTTDSWEKIFQKDGKVFMESHEDMDSIIQLLKERGTKKILDLGSGSGRHMLKLAKNGFSVFGLDNSATGIEITKKELEQEGLRAELVKQEMTETFPWEDNFFDAIISVQVIHHADVQTIKEIISEIERTLKKDGFVFVTVPKLKNQGNNLEMIEPNTYVPLDGPEKGLPHHYFTPEELTNFFSNFSISDIHVDNGNHYCLSALKK